MQNRVDALRCKAYNAFHPAMLADRLACWRLERFYRKHPAARAQDLGHGAGIG